MTLNRILKTALNFKGATVDKADFRENAESRSKRAILVRLLPIKIG